MEAGTAQAGALRKTVTLRYFSRVVVACFHVCT